MSPDPGEVRYGRRCNELRRYRAELERALNVRSELRCLLCVGGGEPARHRPGSPPWWEWVRRVTRALNLPELFVAYPLTGGEVAAALCLYGTGVSHVEYLNSVRPFEHLAAVALDHLLEVPARGWLVEVPEFRGLMSIRGAEGWLWLCHVLGWKPVSGLGYLVDHLWLQGDAGQPIPYGVFRDGPDDVRGLGSLGFGAEPGTIVFQLEGDVRRCSVCAIDAVLRLAAEWHESLTYAHGTPRNQSRLVAHLEKKPPILGYRASVLSDSIP
jgi:hypothetical protein